MNPKTQRFIEYHIQRITGEFEFENQKKKNPEKCVCYSQGKCHDIENLNCLLCYCPEYDNSIVEGGCRINSSKGRWFVDKRLPAGKIWDCSYCDYPHQKEVVEGFLRKVFNLKR